MYVWYSMAVVLNAYAFILRILWLLGHTNVWYTVVAIYRSIPEWMFSDFLNRYTGGKSEQILGRYFTGKDATKVRNGQYLVDLPPLCGAWSLKDFCDVYISM